MEKQLLAKQSAEYCPIAGHSAKQTKLKWTGSIIEWVELIYTLYLVRRINGGKITLKELFIQMGTFFDFEVKEFANYFMNIKSRKDGNRTKFMDVLKNTLLEYMSEFDRKSSRK